MTDVSLEALGLTPEVIADRVVDSLVQRVIDDEVPSLDNAVERIEKRLFNETRSLIDAAVDKIATDHLGPLVVKIVEESTYRKTSRYGEPRAQGESMSFLEMLSERAATWLQEVVDDNGEPTDRNGRGPWKSRAERLVARHLDDSVSAIVVDAVKSANDSIVKGIRESVESQLSKINKSLRGATDD